MIPKNAKRAFKGIIFDVYHWKQKTFDGSYTTFEGIKRIPTVQVVVTKGKKVLMLKEVQPGRKNIRPSLPGGRINRGERPLSAAKRELLEETGFKARSWKLINVYNDGGGKMDWPISLFAAKDFKKVKEPELDAGEKIEYEWVTLEKLLDSYTEVKNNLLVDFIRSKYDKKKLNLLKKKLF